METFIPQSDILQFADRGETTMIETDWKYWNKKMLQWTDMAEEYYNLGDMEGFERCMEKVNRWALYKDEAQGLVFVVTGRKGFGASLKNRNSLGYKLVA